MSNPFLVIDGPGTDGLPRRVYALVEQIEQLPTGWFLQFDAIDADWFDGNALPYVQTWWDPHQRRRFFDNVRIYSIEVTASRQETRKLLGPAWNQRPPRFAALLSTAEPFWLEYDLDPRRGTRIAIYRNLFGNAEEYRIRAVRRPSTTALVRLNDTDPLSYEPDASDEEVEGVLAAQGTPDFVAVYDVGQGNMNAASDASGRPLTYFDFGGGVLGNTRTFPSAFTDACFHNQPLIILSHWDKDHWSSACRFNKAVYRTWIVPRQTPLGKSHGALISDILSHGVLMVWSPAGGTVAAGGLSVVVCSGSGRNHSGLAVYVDGPSAADYPVLLPADAAYSYVPGALTKSLHALVASHHGAHLAKSGVPSCVGGASSRIAYSVGRNNTYGHPTTTARTDHDAAGWHDPGVNSARSVDLVRMTDKLHPAMCSISFHWSTCTPPSVPCASPCGGCSLQIHQT